MTWRMRGLKRGGGEVAVTATEGGVLHVMTPAQIWTLKGYGQQAMTTAAVASLIVRPSALSLLTLYNNSTNKTFVIERAFAFNLVSIANGQFGIWLCSHPVGMTAPTGNNITIRNSTSGQPAGTEGIADTDEAVTDNGWFPWGVNQTSVTATVPGSQAEASVGGRIMIPPTAGISIQVVAQTAVVTCTVGFHWFAVPEAELAVN